MVLSANHRPVESDGGEIVGDVSHLPHVCFARRARLPRIKVDRLNAAPIRCEVGDPILKVKIARWVAGAHLKVAWNRLHCLVHQLPRDLDNLGVMVHLSTVVAKDSKCCLRGEPHTYLFQYLERGCLKLVQPLLTLKLDLEGRPHRLDSRTFDRHAC